MATIEDIYSTITRTGVQSNFDVVAEFCVSPRDRSFQKNIDLAWLERRDDSNRFGSLRKWKIIAAFEIEGFDVPIDRIEIHSRQFGLLRLEEGRNFPCYIPLYTHALHRANPNWGSDTPDRKIFERIEAAKRLGDVVKVCDGRDMQWLGNVIS